MKAVAAVVVLLFALAVAHDLSWLDGGVGIVPDKDENGNNHPICPTDTLWDKKALALYGNRTVDATCVTESTCDNPAVRDGTKTNLKTIRVIVNVICNGVNNCPSGVNQQRINEQFAALNNDYAASNIQFTVIQTNFHVNPTLACIAAYSQTNSKWYNNIVTIKNTYASSPSSALNVFVTCQTAGTSGTLLGIGTFPWDSAALTSQGGVWMNAEYTHGQGKTLAHEMGHNVGLWHTFHGVGEMTGCNDACYERPHASGASTADTIGDFCSDTLSTPLNYYCSTPAGSDSCSGTAWSKYGTNLNNFMAYTPDTCMNTFTSQQTKRAHCYICSELKGYLVDSSACN